MRNRWMRRLASAAAVAMISTPIAAQQPVAPAAQPDVGPKIGEMAPDFEFAGITRYGKLAESRRLSNFRGKTVVLAFYPKARSRG